MSKYFVSALVNPVVDLLVHVEDEFLQKLDLEKSSYGLMTSEEQARILGLMPNENPTLMSGGSLANSIMSFAQLGGKASLFGCLGKDRFGKVFLEECIENNINPEIYELDGDTAVCLSFITPDGERTMRTNLGVSDQLASDHIKPDVLSDSKWVFAEGFLLSSKLSTEAIFRSLEICKKAGSRFGLTASAPFIVQNFKAELDEIISETDLLFCNSDEAELLTDQADPAKAAEALANLCEWVVVTDSENGAYIVDGENVKHVQAAKVANISEKTGAGDMFAGVEVYGLSAGLKPYQASAKAVFLAARVIEQVGARLPTESIKDFYQSAT